MPDAREIGKIASFNQGKVIRVTVPAKVAFNLDEFQKLVGGLAERLGCLPCLSGAACFFDFERSFVVNPEGELEAIGPMY
jgi:hypothetical protein